MMIKETTNSDHLRKLNFWSAFFWSESYFYDSEVFKLPGVIISLFVLI